MTATTRELSMSSVMSGRRLRQNSYSSLKMGTATRLRMSVAAGSSGRCS